MRDAPPEDMQALIADRPSPAAEVLVSVVVPTYREADNPRLVPQITAGSSLGRTRSSSSMMTVTTV